MRILLIIVATLAALFVGFIWVLSGAPVPSIPPAKTPAPVGFDASQFQDVADLQDVDGVELINLGVYGDFFGSHYMPDNKALWAQFFKEPDTAVYAVFSKDGNVVDSLETTQNLNAIDDFLIGLEGVFELSADGFSDVIPFVELAADMQTANLQRMVEASRYYLLKRWTEFPHDIPDFDTRTSWHLFYHDGRWKRSKTNKDEFLGYKGGEDYASLTTQYTHEPDRQNMPSAISPDKATLELVFFDQKEFLSRRPAPMGSTTGVGRPAQWLGTGYYALEINGSTLRFKIQDDVQFTGSPGSNGLLLESHEDLDFVLLRHKYRSNEGHAYIVRARIEG